MVKTFAAIDRHVDAESAYVPLRPDAVDCWDACPMVDAPTDDLAGLEDVVYDVDPDVVVENHRFRHEARRFHRDFPLVHVRHGASVGRGEEWATTRSLDGVVDVALAPGGFWARHYREQFDSAVDVSVVGIPEADPLVETDPPGERRVLYAPTNHNYGGGCYLPTAEHVLDVFAGTDYELSFRPHPMDREEEPAASLTRRCRDRIETMPNVVFDDRRTPRESMLAADLLISDYSGLVTEWLHTGRPLIQLTDVVADRTVPVLGHTTDRLTIDLVDEVYRARSPSASGEREETLADLAIPMDGRAGERAAREVAACTQ